MFNLSKNPSLKYRGRLLKAFPRELKDDVETIIGVLPLGDTVVKLCDGNLHQVNDLIHPSTIEVQLNGEPIVIPCRLYFNEPDAIEEARLTKTQKAILNCIYLRHHNGYIRQSRLEKLVNEYDPWVVPFTFELFGEYVYEILELKLQNRVFYPFFHLLLTLIPLSHKMHYIRWPCSNIVL